MMYMTTISHSYAEKILAEQPTSIHIIDNQTINSDLISLKNFHSSFSATTGKIVRSVNTAKDLGFIPASVTITKTAPIVYGSNYSVYLNTSNCLTIPAQGILTYNGRYNTNTLEFWTRIDKPYFGKRKIVGAFTTTDDGNGLYVNQTSFILKIGSKSGTAYIKDFNRPFLIQIANTANSSTLIVNGESLISLSLSDSDLETLTDTKYLSFGQGTYDCISTYAYQIDPKQATIHFGYGHGVTFPDSIVRNFDGKSVVIDYSKAQYASNYNYTTNASWKQSKSDNINIDNTHISNFQYNKPILNSDTKTIFDLESTINGTTFSLKRTLSTMATAISNLEIGTLDIMNQPVKAFYMHGYYTEADGRPTSEQIIFKVVNKRTRDYFSIIVNGYSIAYNLKYKSATETNLITFNSPASNLVLNSGKYNFIIGIDIDKFVSYCITNNLNGNELQGFFANQSDLIIYVGGNDDLTNSKTCNAEIYSVKLLTKENLDKRSSLVFSSGIFNYPAAINTNPSGTEATQNNIIGSYDIRPYQDILNYASTGYRLSVASNGYWKNDIPLTQFCKTVKDSVGNDIYTYDFVQFNIDYEASLVQKTISSKNYFDTTSYEFSNVKTYITFEPLNATYQADSAFTTLVESSSDRTIIPGASWATTKYEVVDGFIIYPPTGIDLKEYTMVIHIDFNVVDTENNVINIQKMQLASQAYNDNSSNPIGTKYGTAIIPYTYTISGVNRVYNYSGYNPFLINKKDNPYLYMARDSGIKLVGFDTSTAGVYRGIKIPINSELKPSCNISIMQLSVFYNAERDISSAPYLCKFPYSSEQIFEIKTNTRTIQFFLTKTGNGDTATISALSNGITNENISYYLNGEYLETPTIYTNQWYTLGIAFTSPLIFDSTEGEFDLVGGISIDNLSYYQFNSVSIAQNTFPATWNRWLSYDWSYIANNYFWGELPIITSISTFDMSSMFTGTNRLTGNSNLTNNLGAASNQYNYFGDLNSQIIVTSAV